MNVSKYLRLLPPLCLWMLASAPVIGETPEDRGADTAYAPRPEPKDPNLARVAMVRLWYIGGIDDPKICLVKELSSGPAKIIDTGLRAGTLSRYFPMKPGEITLHILDGSVEAPSDPSEKLPLEEKKLVEPFSANMRAGTYSTIIIREIDGVLQAEAREDKKRVDSSAPALRIHDFSGLPDIDVRLVKNPIDEKADVNLWNSSRGTPEAEIELPRREVYYIQAVRHTGAELRTVGFYEVQLARGMAISIILLPGPDGTGAMQATVDATPDRSYSAARIKFVAEGAQ
jgi:hypothetical protein